MSCGAVVLAAGTSSRMGTSKVLLPIGATTVLGRIIDELSRSLVDEIVVVVGHEAARVTEAIRDRPVSIAENARHEAGMLSSLRCGLLALPESCASVLVVLGDQPRLRATTVNALLAAYARSGTGLVVPTHGGRRGHPIVVSMRYRSEILERHDAVGLRGLLQAHPDDILELDAGDDSVLLDMDQPLDYARDLRALEGP